MALLEIRDLKTYFALNEGVLSRILGEKLEMVKAVDKVSFDVADGEVVGIAGETGCGKTTLGKSILLLVRPQEGTIYFDKKNILELRGKEIKQFRRQTQMVPQDPLGSLNPKIRVKDSIAEPLKTYGLVKSRDEVNEKVLKLLEAVDLSSEYGEKYPFQLSGGEARRVTIARSIALSPKLIVCDELTSGLDVSISAKILNVMKKIHDKFNLTYIWISHNLHVLNYISNRLLVMYLGKIVEAGNTKKIFKNPAHPYTQALLLSLPKLDGNSGSTKKDIHLKGEIPNPIYPPPGCRFHPRCKHKMSKCIESEPKMIQLDEDHQVACWLGI